MLAHQVCFHVLSGYHRAALLARNLLVLCHVLLHHRTRDRLTTRVTQHNVAPTVTLVKDKHMS